MTSSSIATDSTAEKEIIRRVALFLGQQRLLSGALLSLAADRGVITLRGTAATFHQRQLIVSATRRVAGVTQVVDELRVEKAAAPRQPSALGRHATLTAAAMVATVAVIALAGCGGSGPRRVTTHSAKGSIAYQGQPISGAFLALHPKSGSNPNVPTSTAIVQPDGTFSVTTYDAGDGAPEGDYVVTVQWRKLTKSGGEFVPGPNLLPTRYSRPETSDVVIHVASGGNQLVPIALKR